MLLVIASFWSSLTEVSTVGAGPCGAVKGTSLVTVLGAFNTALVVMDVETERIVWTTVDEPVVTVVRPVLVFKSVMTQETLPVSWRSRSKLP